MVADLNTNAEFLLLRATSAAGRAWDRVLQQSGDVGAEGLAWVEIGLVMPTAAIAMVASEKLQGRVVEERDPDDGCYRIFAEHLIKGPAFRSLAVQDEACRAFAAVLIEAGFDARVGRVEI